MTLRGARIAVTGATGFLGRYVVDALLARGAHVIGVVRNPDRVPCTTPDASRARLPIVTAVAYFESCAGGAFAFYPNGPDGPARTLPVRHNTAVVLDTDSVFHGVDRVAEGRRCGRTFS
jgi:nucleoside-diphosphate-sugar epimerase